MRFQKRIRNARWLSRALYFFKNRVVQISLTLGNKNSSLSLNADTHPTTNIICTGSIEVYERVRNASFEKVRTHE